MASKGIVCRHCHLSFSDPMAHGLSHGTGQCVGQANKRRREHAESMEAKLGVADNMVTLIIALMQRADVSEAVFNEADMMGTSGVSLNLEARAEERTMTLRLIADEQTPLAPPPAPAILS